MSGRLSTLSLDRIALLRSIASAPALTVSETGVTAIETIDLRKGSVRDGIKAKAAPAAPIRDGISPPEVLDSWVEVLRSVRNDDLDDWVTSPLIR